MKRNILILIVLTISLALNAQDTLKIWDEVPNDIKDASYKEEVFYNKNNAPRLRKVVEPTLTVYLPEGKTNTPAIIICPGGGYVHQAINEEGHFVARQLAEHGIAAFVLKYRLPSDKIMTKRSYAPMADAHKAIMLVREKSSLYGIDSTRVGIMGFSAGGHLAASASVNYKSKAERPDFSVLMYPVITMDSTFTHLGSRKALIGGVEDEVKLAEYFSCEKRITKDTPPAFMVHAANDRAVPMANTLRYAEALQRCGVPVEVHIYPSGGHGFGLATQQHQGQWFEQLIRWINK